LKIRSVGKQITVAGKGPMSLVYLKRSKGGISDNGMDEITLVPMNFAKTL